MVKQTTAGRALQHLVGPCSLIAVTVESLQTPPNSSDESAECTVHLGRWLAAFVFCQQRSCARVRSSRRRRAQRGSGACLAHPRKIPARFTSVAARTDLGSRSLPPYLALPGLRSSHRSIFRLACGLLKHIFHLHHMENKQVNVD